MKLQPVLARLFLIEAGEVQSVRIHFAVLFGGGCEILDAIANSFGRSLRASIFNTDRLPSVGHPFEKDDAVTRLTGPPQL